MASNIPAAREMYDCFIQGDIPGLLSHLDENVEWEHDWGISHLPLFRPRHGPSDVAGFFKALQSINITKFKPLNYLEGGNQVAVPILIEATVKATGKKIVDLEMHLWTFGEDGKVTHLRHLVDTLQIERAFS